MVSVQKGTGPQDPQRPTYSLRVTRAPPTDGKPSGRLATWSIKTAVYCTQFLWTNCRRMGKRTGTGAPAQKRETKAFAYARHRQEHARERSHGETPKRKGGYSLPVALAVGLCLAHCRTAITSCWSAFFVDFLSTQSMFLPVHSVGLL